MEHMEGLGVCEDVLLECVAIFSWELEKLKVGNLSTTQKR